MYLSLHQAACMDYSRRYQILCLMIIIEGIKCSTNHQIADKHSAPGHYKSEESKTSKISFVQLPFNGRPKKIKLKRQRSIQLEKDLRQSSEYFLKLPRMVLNGQIKRVVIYKPPYTELS